MTPKIGSAATGLVIQRLTADTTGANANLASLTQDLQPMDPLEWMRGLRTGNIAPELADRTNTVKLSDGQCLLRKNCQHAG